MRFLRYPGGKRKLISFLNHYLPNKSEITGNYIEPFVGGGSVFLTIQPSKAILSDLNKELIDLYKGIRNYPHKVWEHFESFPTGKKGYYKIRDKFSDTSLSYRAARTLYLNRTCFKGMWRHSPNGNFNVGYGGEERRWVITHDNLIELSSYLKHAEIFDSDFESVIKNTKSGDFIFLDPPYKPGEKELKESHYTYSKFTFNDQIRLANVLKDINQKKNIGWILTNTSHKEIKDLYKDYCIVKIPKGTGDRLGIQIIHSKEILIHNLNG